MLYFTGSNGLVICSDERQDLLRLYGQFEITYSPIADLGSGGIFQSFRIPINDTLKLRVLISLSATCRSAHGLSSPLFDHKNEASIATRT